MILAAPVFAQSDLEDHFFSKRAINADGKVTVAEFLSRADGWVAIMDRNTDGVITPEDFRQPEI
ncbi:MAG: hypothetical protein HQ479_14970 [Rhodobacter sp.]|jgi:hypothetical protein|nr:hypothetical protein [Rhodobacter sp.]